MDRNYRRDEDLGLSDLGVSEAQLPSEYGGNVLDNLDEMLQRQERGALDRLYDQQEERGLFRSGLTERRALEEVALPGIEARRGALLDLVGRGLGQQREERLGETGFQRQRQLATEDFDRKMREMEMSLAHQKDLLRLQASLRPEEDGLGEMFTKNIVGSFGRSLGSNLGGDIFKD